MYDAIGESVDDLYRECWWMMKTRGVADTSRNGEVITIDRPVTIQLSNPKKRVLLNAARDANPFFHLAEVVWVLSGSNDVKFLERFNKRYREYADTGTDVVWGAYGYRWRRGFDQIPEIIARLKANRNDRQLVLQMWDPILDLPYQQKHNDRPCNTELMFRVVDDTLDALVVNRSNDMVWGALGANVVVFTCIQEVIAHSAGLWPGKYRVVSNNFHVYPGMPRYAEIRKGGLESESMNRSPCARILQPGETYEDLVADCVAIVEGQLQYDKPRTHWMEATVAPMLLAYIARGHDKRVDYVNRVRDFNWQQAGLEWLHRRQKDQVISS